MEYASGQLGNAMAAPQAPLSDRAMNLYSSLDILRGRLEALHDRILGGVPRPMQGVAPTNLTAPEPVPAIALTIDRAHQVVSDALAEVERINKAL